MSKEDYTWSLAWAMVAWHQATSEADPDRPRVSLGNITAQAGQFENAADQAANDEAIAAQARARLGILLFIWLWNVSKYRAGLPKIQAKRPGNFQIPEPSFLSATYAETLALQGFQEIAWLFSSPPACAKYPAPS